MPTWGYSAGTDGTPTLTGLQVLSLSCVGGPEGGTLTIDGGDTITLAPSQPFSLTLGWPVTAPAIVFTDTVAYFVETLA
jgi:hypothetical protein